MTRVDRYVDAGPVVLHLVELGAGVGPPIIVLPGILTAAEMMVPFAERLAAGQRTVVVDQRGRGASDKPPAGYALADYLQDALAVIRSYGQGPFRLVGHSLGARVGIKVAHEAAELVESLVVIDPPLSGPELAGPRTTQSPARFLEELDALRASPTVATARRFQPSWSEADLAARATWLPLTRESAIVETFFQIFYSDDARALLTQWAELKSPTLLAYGEAAGGLIGPPQLGTLTATHGDLTVAPITKAGHQIPWQDPDGLIEAITSFWAARREQRGVV